LGKTAFFKKQKPTPYDEAISLVWYLENIFYPAAGRILSQLKSQFPEAVKDANPVIQMGFWPGGDRDGNPFVTTDTTLKVADALRGSIIKCYYLDVRRMRRRLTFEGVDNVLLELEKKLYNNIFIPGQRTDLSKEEILETLKGVQQTLIYQHNGLFVDLVAGLINRVELFGLHFASLDIRQDSSVHGRVLEQISGLSDTLPKDYAQLSADKKVEVLTKLDRSLGEIRFEDPLVQDTLDSIRAIRDIQQFNGEHGCERYIISQCNSELNILEVLSLFTLAGWNRDDVRVDIVPLFETVEDLQQAARVMKAMYESKVYGAHLTRRKSKQTIMLGFSDGTKDGGYLMANYSIYKAKEELTAISRQYGVDVVFFDGRGGPPARGGGKTHKF
jgi:phosphoenolpyruvate carboxylase